MNRSRLYLYGALLSLVIGYVLAFILFQHHYESAGSGIGAQLCGSGTDSSCNQVNKSEYSSIAGVPVALFGMIFYLVNIILLIPMLLGRHSNGFILLVLGWLAVGIDVVLLLISLFLVGALCKLCAFTYIASGFFLWSMYMYLSSESVKFSWDKAVAQVRSLPALFLVSLTLVVIVHGAWNYQLSAQEGEKLSNSDNLLEQAFEEFYKEFKARPAAKIDRSGLTPKGSENPVLIIDEYADPMCPYCQLMYKRLKIFMANHGDKVQFYYHPFPLDITCNKSMSRQLHAGACELSQATLCAGEQGAFWPVHDEIFEQVKMFKSGVSLQTLTMLKSIKGLQQSQFKSCYSGSKAKLSKILSQANRLGVNSTPTFIVNGRPMPSLQAEILEFFLLKMIEKES